MAPRATLHGAPQVLGIIMDNGEDGAGWIVTIMEISTSSQKTPEKWQNFSIKYNISILDLVGLVA